MNGNPPLARRDVIAGRLAEGQPVNAAALALEFRVSEDSIRRDLRALAADGLCRRVYGGALPISPAASPMAVRMDRAVARKEALAKAALSTIAPGELLFLDSGSTNLALVDMFPDDFDVTVATNCIAIAGAVLRRQDIELLMIGGVVDLVVGGCVDAAAVLALTRMNIDRCFIGACSVSAHGGVSAFDPSDAVFKRTLLERSRHGIVLTLNEKLSAQAHHRVAEVGDVDLFVVEHDVPAEDVEALKRSGASVLVAGP